MVARTMLIAFLVLLTYLSVTNASNITTDEASLLAFKAQITSDPNEMLSKNWTKGTHICNWIGISCSKKVTSLVLKSFGFRGSIATDIGNLSFLNSLDIGNNSFHGQIPDEIGRLRRLKYLYLQMNNLTGQIPQSLGFLTRLQVLHLSENRLFGNVPLSIFSVSSLKDIDLSQNYELTGSLPNEICSNLPVLEYISLQDNQFVGELPKGLNKCTKLEVLSLSYNKFTGNLPRDMWNMSKVQELFIGWNNFTGDIPNEMNLPSIRKLSLRRNELVGTLPPSLGNLSTLVMIDIGENKIHGNIPPQLGHLSSLEGLYLGSNALSDQEKWAKIKAVLKVGAQGSSILATTRLETVGSIMGTWQPYQLSILSLEDCWLLFKQRAFGHQTETNPDLVGIGKEIVKKCGGCASSSQDSWRSFKLQEGRNMGTCER
ncbi:hypothetical protein H5410_042884 [Solanum commersonii]|uniref:Leucine-rich repeat-containing N-terminal plant-type domain-containing protein n=1 Tax=Solanum commersonii TaxID=4109 RepID=A0A9J5XXA4_SOLCO|nr:hypothetical protein H5410_042884 [Solanum commersonii]